MARTRVDGLIKSETFMQKHRLDSQVFRAMIYFRRINGLIESGAVVPVKMANNDLLIHPDNFFAWVQDKKLALPKG